jgi:multisubunit Na+/H+ antiporter MnhB subunit
MPSPLSADEPLDPEAARVLSKVRRLMAISAIFTGVGVAAVLGIVGYRVFKNEGAKPALTEAAATLPKGARVVSTAVADGRIVLTVDVGGQTELHLYDLQTLAPRGRLKIAVEP